MKHFSIDILLLDLWIACFAVVFDHFNIAGKLCGFIILLFRHILITPSFILHRFNSIKFCDELLVCVHICHGRKSNLVEFQILLVETPIGLSIGRKSNWSFYR